MLLQAYKGASETSAVLLQAYKRSSESSADKNNLTEQPSELRAQRAVLIFLYAHR